MINVIFVIKDKVSKFFTLFPYIIVLFLKSICNLFLIKHQEPPKIPTFVNRFEKSLRTLSNLYYGEFVYVLTDIVDSTYLWNNYTMMMREIIRIHHTIGTRLIYENNGYEVKKEGDSYFAVFEDIQAARNFAIIFMNEIDHRCNQFGPSVKLRIGIEKGFCFVIKDGKELRFYGDGPNRANKLCIGCNPGEISISGNKILKFAN